MSLHAAKYSSVLDDFLQALSPSAASGIEFPVDKVPGPVLAWVVEYMTLNARHGLLPDDDRLKKITRPLDESLKLTDSDVPQWAEDFIKAFNIRDLDLVHQAHQATIALGVTMLRHLLVARVATIVLFAGKCFLEACSPLDVPPTDAQHEEFKQANPLLWSVPCTAVVCHVDQRERQERGTAEEVSASADASAYASAAASAAAAAASDMEQLD